MLLVFLGKIDDCGEITFYLMNNIYTIYVYDIFILMILNVDVQRSYKHTHGNVGYVKVKDIVLIIYTMISETCTFFKVSSME